jgi:hypothetical protein
VSYIQNFGDLQDLSTGDAVICHWGCIISFRDAYSPHPHPHLFPEDDVAAVRDFEDLQNFGYVTLLSEKDFYIE